MKRLAGMVMVIAVLIGMGGCSSTGQGKRYSDLAKQFPFGEIFPSHTFSMNFENIDEAYEYVNTAQEKFYQAGGKPLAKGLSARLKGPEIKNDKPVFLICFMTASSASQMTDLSKTNKPLEQELRSAISTSVIFLVFYEGRGTSISRFYLDDGYTFTSNSQYETFNLNDVTYEAEYPIGWGTEQAFKYLKKEIN